MNNIYKPTVNKNGIEGDDLLFHLSILGHSIDSLPDHCFFFPLVNHYNTHGPQWIEQQTQQAQQYDTVVFYDLVHTGDYEHRLYSEFVSNFDHPNRVYLTVNQSPDFKLADVKVISWDFMWNRYKSYYTHRIPEQLHLHHYAGPSAYHLPELNFDKPKEKLFMSLTGREFGYRTHLYEFVKDYDGYVSNRTRGITLEQQPVVGAFCPVPDQFYLDSYISIYTESNFLAQDLIHITEKTFEPLVKGHIVLPFSNPGTVDRLVNMGFVMPDFVDYSFDQEPDPATRLNMLLEEFKRLSMQNIPRLYKEHAQVFKHNQQCLQTIDYDQQILELYNV